MTPVRWAALAVTLIAVAAGCGGNVAAGPAASPSATPSPVQSATPSSAQTLTVTGVMTVDAGSLQSLVDPSRDCFTSRGYNDIHEGTHVTVTDGRGDVVGVGELGPVRWSVDGSDCEHSFTVYDIAADRPFYGVEVAHRGVLTYPESEIRGALQLTLGG